jgi:hypothetical protein
MLYRVHFAMSGIWTRNLGVKPVWTKPLINQNQLSKLNIKFSPIIVVTTKYLAKFQSPRAITQPKIIGPEWNVNLICNLSLYTHIPDFWYESV